MKSNLDVYWEGDVGQLRPSDEAIANRDRRRAAKKIADAEEIIRLEAAGIVVEKPVWGRKGGLITDFSYNSRLRLKKDMHMATGLESFITITLHDSTFFNIKDPRKRIKHADGIMKAIREWLFEEYGINGFVVRHLKNRKSGWYKDQVTSHFHLLLDHEISEKEIQEIKVFIVGAMKLPEPWYDDLALKSENLIRVAAIKNKDELHAKIGYMTKSLCPKALEKLGGISIGRSWYQIGTPAQEKPIQLSLDGKVGSIFRRQAARYIEARTRRYSHKHSMSKALKLSIMDPAAAVTIYMPSADILKLHALAVELAKDAPADTRCPLSRHMGCKGTVEADEKFCPHCIEMLGRDGAEIWLTGHEAALAA